jgi:hypothetical protein
LSEEKLMKTIRTFCLLVLASGMALAQANPPNNGNVADDLKTLREAIAAQQKQIAEQQKQLENLQKQLETKAAAQPQVINAALTTNTPNTNTPVTQSDTEKPKESPLSFRIGSTEFTPGGFVDFENVFRTTNTGNVTATNFWAIPFGNTVQGHLSEYRSTGQYSRINLKTTTKFKGSDVTGYVEADFNGNDAANVFVTSNPHTMRIRLYWVDLKADKWEFLGGQTWGLETPNRVGVSPAPADLSVTLGEDAQTHVGVNYTRAAEFRLAYHFSKEFVWAVAAQNPQQYVGQAGEVAFPLAFNGNLGAQFDTGAGAVAGAPNAYPDFLTKIAYDHKYAGRSFHFEVGGLMTSAKATVQRTIATPGFIKHTTLGAGIMGAVNYEIVKNVRALAQGMWGPGVGRYIIGMGPQVVAFPVAAVPGGICGTGNLGGCDIRLSPVRGGDTLVGLEAQAGKSQFGFYYGGAYFQRNCQFIDPTNPTPLTPIGFGCPLQANNTVQNRAIQEGTVDWTQTFWRNPQYGAVLLVTQASYVTRAPWWTAPNIPKNAHLAMGYVSLRYVLP